MLGMYSSIPLLNEGGMYIWDHAWEGPEGISKLHEVLAQIFKASTPAKLHSVSQLAPMTWEIPYDQLNEEDET